jgi:hypothetical protein
MGLLTTVTQRPGEMNGPSPDMLSGPRWAVDRSSQPFKKTVDAPAWGSYGSARASSPILYRTNRIRD